MGLDVSEQPAYKSTAGAVLITDFDGCNETCSGPGGGVSEQGSERQRVIRSR